MLKYFVNDYLFSAFDGLSSNTFLFSLRLEQAVTFGFRPIRYVVFFFFRNEGRLVINLHLFI